MTLDEFVILFTTNASKARADIAGIDAELDTLEKKGKKRDENENKRYAELRKQRKEAIEQLKGWQNATDKVAGSFTDMASAIGGAAAAFLTFNGFKSALIDANRLNVSLENLSKTYGGITPEKLKQLSFAYERTTGLDKGVLLGAYPQLQGLINAAFGDIPFEEGLRRLHAKYQNLSPERAQAVLAQSAPAAIPLLPWLQSKDFDKSIKDAPLDTAKDFAAALANEKSAKDVTQSLNHVATQIDTQFTTAIVKFNDGVTKFVEAFNGHPIAATGGVLGAIGLTTLGTGWGLSKLLPALAGEGVGGLFALGARGGLLGLITTAMAASTWWALGKEQEGVLALGDALGLKRRATSSAGTPPVMNSTRQGSNRDRIAAAFRSAGYNDSAIAGWLANAQAESSLNPSAANRGHVGLFQWDAPRRAAIKKALGIDVANASIEDQVRAAAWEARQRGLGPEAFTRLSSYQSGSLISSSFEIPALTQQGLALEAARRGNIAAGYGTVPPRTAIAAASGGGTKTYNIKIDEVRVETHASDAPGIAKQISVELVNQIRMTMSNFDDGRQA